MKGDEVILTGWRVGEIYFGGYSQFAKVNGDFLVKKPKNISSRASYGFRNRRTNGSTMFFCYQS